ncbi:Mg2 transporter protein, corA-like/zinc transport protein ZntB [Physcia stellaris]|nr:Mg2 transporter protein, corA-like/zinc transport protein ZntB [Physcia stellaris]
MDPPDYILNLREFIQEGRRPDAAEQYLDSVSFWRNAYEKSQDVVQQLRVRVSDLEQRLELSAGVGAQVTQITAASQQKRKRARPIGTSESGAKATKKRKTAGTADKSTNSNVQQCILDYDVDLSEDADGGCSVKPSQSTVTDRTVNKCLRRIFVTQQAISKLENDATKGKDLARLAIHSAADACRILRSIHSHTTLSVGPNTKAQKATTRIQEQQAAHTHAQLMSDAETKCLATFRLFPFLLKALTSLGQFPDTKHLHGQVIHCIISIFQVLLEHVCSLSACEGVQKVAIAADSKKIKKAEGRLLAETADFLAAPNPASETPPTVEDEKVIKKLCQLAVAMMNDLDMSHTSGRELFDGFLFHLFMRVGDTLKVFIFDVQAPRTAALDESIAVCQAQAPYLVYLLKHAMKLIEKKSWSKGIPQEHSSTVDYPHRLDSKPDSLSTFARVRLQHTLLKAVFGEHADEYVESLKKPPCPSIDSDLEIATEVWGQKGRNIPEWFKNEVWQTVGWDVLRGMIQWN